MPHMMILAEFVELTLIRSITIFDASLLIVMAVGGLASLAAT